MFFHNFFYKNAETKPPIKSIIRFLAKNQKNFNFFQKTS